jgi:hypothetical protein
MYSKLAPISLAIHSDHNLTRCKGELISGNKNTRHIPVSHFYRFLALFGLNVVYAGKNKEIGVRGCWDHQPKHCNVLSKDLLNQYLLQFPCRAG